MSLYASYVVLQLELQKHIARSDRQLECRLAGEPIELSLALSEFTDTIEIVAPDPSGERVIRLLLAAILIAEQFLVFRLSYHPACS